MIKVLFSVIVLGGVQKSKFKFIFNNYQSPLYIRSDYVSIYCPIFLQDLLVGY